MKRNNFTRVLGIVTIVGVLGLGTYAVADGNGRYGKGKGNCVENRVDGLGEAVSGQAATERSAFFKATGDLRREIFQKHLELQSEMAKKNPDAARAGSIQKEISELDVRFGRERLEHRLRMKAIHPELGSGYGMRQGSSGHHQNGGGRYCRN